MSANPANQRDELSPVWQICGGLTISLLLGRFFLVAESAGQGDTLWMVALSLAVLCCWWLWSAPLLTSLKALDWCLGLLVAGHLASGSLILATVGEKRSALNLMWEWVGILVGWCLLRRLCSQWVCRRELLAGMLAAATSIAGFGLYQHYVEFPAMAARYGPLIDRVKLSDGAAAAEARRQLADERISFEGPALTLFEKRLRDSREPLGFFALANSFGGFLAVTFVLAVAVADSARRSTRSQTRRLLPVWISIILLLGWCLLLTKSRTAWIGASIGCVIWFVSQGRWAVSAGRAKGMAGFLILLVIAAWCLSRFGGLDRQVLTEAPKSLQYRLQYWTATSRMLRDHFWMGVGPGQFRSAYLLYKLPEASEEISDPHNLLLDVAANGGLLALGGLISLIVTLFRTSGASKDEPLSPQSGRPWVALAVSAAALIGCGRLLFTGEDDRLLVLLPVAVLLYWGIRRLLDLAMVGSLLRFAALASCFTLVVHLLGAGGIEMPAFALLLLALAALSSGDHEQAASVTHQPVWLKFAAGGGALVTIMGLIETGIRPVTVVQQRLFSGDQLVQKGASERADTTYSSAAVADTLSPEPWRRRAELAFRRVEADLFRSNESFQNAVHLQDEAARRDPANFHNDRRVGEWWIARWRTSRQSADAESAVAAFDRAWKRYPTNAGLMADLAFSLEAAEKLDQAKVVAELALKQDSINHDRGHVDRYLADPIQTRLKKLMADSTIR